MKWICVALCILTGSAAAQSAGRQIAITFDDLPVASGAFAEKPLAQAEITKRLLASLTRNQVPAIGFVNEGKLAPHGPVEPARVAELQQWIDAGMELGNHTYSHLDLNETSLAVYTADMVRGDSVTTSLLLAARRPAPEWFRHPFLSTGRSLATRTKFEHALAERGYRVAPVTVNSDEYLFAGAYDRLAARHDSAGMNRVAGEYLDYMTRVVAYYEHLSTAFFGREIPQVLLLHANVLNADHFDALAGMLRSRGYTFVPIGRAVGDSAYQSPDHYTGPDGMSWLHRWALTAGKPRSFFAGFPKVPSDVTRLVSRR